MCIRDRGYIAGGGTQPKEVNGRILEEAEPKIVKIAKTIRDRQRLPEEQAGKAIMSKVLNPLMSVSYTHLFFEREAASVITVAPHNLAASHKEVKSILVGTGVSGYAGSDSFRGSLPIFKGMRICPT